MTWSQLQTILWLRFRLSRNQWSKGGNLNAAITVIVTLLVLLLAVGVAVGGTMAGVLALREAPPQTLLLTWDAFIGVFLFFWLMNIVVEIQRSEAIDIGRLLHLPVSIRGVFFVNYLASHLTLSLVVMVPAMLGVALGLTIARGWLMAGLFPLVLSFVFMVTAWTYYLRGWLVALMVNPRRRRAIIVGITAGFMILSQLPNLLMQWNAQRQVDRMARVAAHPGNAPSRGPKFALPPAFWTAHRWVPFLWTADGALSLAGGNAWPAVLGSAGACLIGALGLRQAYRSTVRFYQGHTSAARARRKVEPATSPRQRARPASRLLERELPAVPPEAAALGLATFRSYCRASELKMALASSFIAVLFLGLMALRGNGAGLSPAAKPFLATAGVAVTCLGLLQILCNQFGLDRDAFRGLVLLPTSRSMILLGKNLAFLPIIGAIGLTLQVLLLFVAHLPFPVFLSGILQLASAFCLFSIFGNFISMLAPYHIAPGSLKPTKTSSKTTLIMIGLNLLFPLAVAPLFLAPLASLWLAGYTGIPSWLVNLLASSALLCGSAFIYWHSLEPLGDMLDRREQRILQIVTHEIE